MPLERHMTSKAGQDSGSGQLIGGRYRLGAELGHGGFGVVYAATDELLRRDVAVKEIRLPRSISADERAVLRQRVLREARSAGRLQHPGLVPVFDVLDADGRPWIIMELVDGRSLADVIRDEGPLPRERVARIGISLAYALEAAHRTGIVHRDVKPANVLIGADRRARLTDFGIALSAGDPTLTRTGVLLGSPSYIAPERARGEAGGPGSDIWALGATLFTAVEGGAPYERDSAIATLTAIVDGRRHPFRLAGALAPILDDLMAVNPSERPPLSLTRRRLRKVSERETSRRLAGPRVNHSDRERPLGAPAGRAGSAPGPIPAGSVPAGADPAQAAGTDPAAGKTPAATGTGDSPETGYPRPGRPTNTPAVAAAAIDAAAVTAVATGRQPAVLPAGKTAAPPPPVREQAPHAHPEPARAAEPTGAAQVAKAAGTTGAAATAPPARSAGPRSTRRRRAAVAAILAAVLVGTGIVLGTVLASGSDDGPGADGTASGRVAANQAGPQPASTGATARPSAAARASSTASAPAVPVTADPGLAPLDATPVTPPPGWHTYSGPSGWSIAYPDGWEERPAPGSEGRNFSNPQTGAYLHIDITMRANPSALADWMAHEDDVRARVSDYRRVKIAASDGGNGTIQADWEFTHTSGGKTVHVLNRGFVRNGHGYALYWSTADSRWETDLPLMWQLFSTFRPGP